MLNSITSYFYRIMGKLPLKGQLKIESVVAREFFINGGRCIGISILIIFANDLTSLWLPVIIVAMAAMQFFILLCIPNSEASYEVKISPSQVNQNHKA